MRKRVLIVEESDNLRGLAESVLRQNGFEVISVSATDRANEVMQFSKPDLIVTSAGLKASDGKPFYEKVKSDSQMAGLPLLVITPVEIRDTGLNPEQMLDLPVDPNQFLKKVSALLGGEQPMAGSPNTSKSPKENSSPVSESSGLSVDDDFLDAALGIDSLGVTDSEVMDKTSITKSKQANDDSEFSDSRRVESLVIAEDASDIIRKTGGVKTVPQQSGTGKLEIVSDQFGLTEPGAAQPDPFESSDHDYNWFVDSMRQDNEAPAPATTANKSGGLKFDENSASVDPITSVPQSTTPQKDAPSKAESEGVDQFIDEFKKEMEVLRSNEPESIVVASDSATNKDPKADLTWEDSLEKLTPEEIGLFTQKFAKELATKIADIIVSRIDPDKLLSLIKNEIIERARKKS